MFEILCWTAAVTYVAMLLGCVANMIVAARHVPTPEEEAELRAMEREIAETE